MGATEVLLVGVPHLDNPGLDMANTVVDDVLSAHRQEELAAVGAGLARFAPTKVLVEAPRGHRILAKYASYVAGEHELGRNEIEQIGFRVAALCGLKEVSGVDVGDDFWDPRIDELAQMNPRVADVMAELAQLGAAHVEEAQGVLARSTLSEVLLEMNTSSAISAGLVPYLAYLARIRGDGDYLGSDVVANWYRRNLRIFSELLTEAGEGERLLIIFGGGHVPVLQHFIEGSQLFSLHQLSEYLSE